jgi:hypothetical protein
LAVRVRPISQSGNAPKSLPDQARFPSKSRVVALVVQTDHLNPLASRHFERERDSVRSFKKAVGRAEKSGALI